MLLNNSKWHSYILAMLATWKYLHFQNYSKTQAGRRNSRATAKEEAFTVYTLTEQCPYASVHNVHLQVQVGLSSYHFP